MRANFVNVLGGIVAAVLAGILFGTTAMAFVFSLVVFVFMLERLRNAFPGAFGSLLTTAIIAVLAFVVLRPVLGGIGGYLFSSMGERGRETLVRLRELIHPDTPIIARQALDEAFHDAQANEAKRLASDVMKCAEDHQQKRISWEEFQRCHADAAKRERQLLRTEETTVTSTTTTRTVTISPLTGRAVGGEYTFTLEPGQEVKTGIHIPVGTKVVLASTRTFYLKNMGKYEPIRSPCYVYNVNKRAGTIYLKGGDEPSTVSVHPGSGICPPT